MLDKQKSNMLPKKIYRRQEFKEVAEFIMSHQTALKEEFLGGYDSLEEATLAQSIPTFSLAGNPGSAPYEAVKDLIQSRNSVTDEFCSDMDIWQSSFIKYEWRDQGIRKDIREDLISKFPTAIKLVETFGHNDCPIANYSCLGPMSQLNRHTGNENRTGEFVRVHVPLIIPEGDVFFEVMGEEIDWSDIFCFNNQFPHSAHNNTNYWRLCFLIDIRCSSIGVPPGMPYNEEFSKNPPPFIRGKIDIY
jgi:hypothetical protein